MADNEKSVGGWGSKQYIGNCYVKYGLDAQRFNKLFRLQEGRCAGCKEKIAHPVSRADVEVAWKCQVDHDHTAPDQRDAVRGLLCPPCNRLLGKVQDNWQLLLNLHTYLLQERPKL